MAGFAKITLVSEHYTNLIVNVFHYRSEEWIPLQGNPFDDSLAFLDAFVAKMKTAYKTMMPASLTLLRAEAVGYADDYTVVTSSPLVRTINEAGTGGNYETSGSFVASTLGLRCGEQVQISGTGHSKRNRGYLSIGPLAETEVDAYGHIGWGANNALDAFAQLVDDTIVMATPAVSLIPIRIHEKWIGVKPVKILLFRTYSDVKGYTLPRMASVRRSRMGEA